MLIGTQTFFHRDYGVLGYPFLHFQRECFWRGELPFWNPFSHCGVPHLAQWGTMSLYPLSLFYVLLPMPWSVGVFSLGHLWLGGLGMYALGRRWLGDGPGAAMAGLAFACGGVAQSSLMWPNYTVALGWMPWVTLLGERAWRQGGRNLVWAALVGALQMLSGAPEIILMTWLVTVLMLAGQLTHDAVPVTACLRFATVVLLVAGLSAAQLLPFFELLEHSQRQAGVSAAKWPMPLWGWANLVLPSFHYFRTPQGVFMQEGQYFFTSYYAGLPVLALAGLAVWRVPRRVVWLIAGVALAGLVLAWGEAFPPNRWLREVLPVAGTIRYPVKFVVLAAFALPLLAGFGVQWLFDKSREPEAGGREAETPRSGERSLWIVGLAALALLGVVFFIAWKFPWPYDQWTLTWQCAVGRGFFLTACCGVLVAFHRRLGAASGLVLSVLLLMMVWLDLRTHLPDLNPTLPRGVMTPGYAVENSDLKAAPQLGEGRVFITPAAEKLLLRSPVADLGQDFIGKRFAQWSNLNVLDGVPKVNGAATLRVREQDEVQEWLYANATNTPTRLLDFLGAAHQSAADNPTAWVKRGPVWPWMTAGQAVNFGDSEETRRALLAESFAPEHEVWLPPEARGFLRMTNATAARVKEMRFRASHAEAFVECDRPALVVVAQTWHPAWEARVDGTPVTLWRANHAFQALEVPAGSHRVQLRYRDRAFERGAWLGLASLTVCAGIVVHSQRRQGARKPHK